MKQWLLLLIFLSIIQCLTACSTLSNNSIRIMPLGDSITAGYTDNPKWQVPFEFGYRSSLFSYLDEAGCNFTFVGNSPEPWDGKWQVPKNKSIPDLRIHGEDKHRGYGGKNIIDINKRVAQFIAEDKPDVILLLIGINGINSNSPQQLDKLVNEIYHSAPTVHLIVAQITPYVNYKQDLWDYNIYIQDILVPRYTDKNYSISTVDFYSLFLNNKDEPTSIAAGLHSNDINHPTAELYKQMAKLWFDELQRETGSKSLICQ
jgi:lysophospholipase L1-like esterase